MIKNDMSFAEYLALDLEHYSRFKVLRQSPKHYLWAKDNQHEDTPAMALGRLTHTAILEPAKFLRQYVLWQGGRRAGKEWEAFRASAGDRQIVSETELAAALAMQKAVRENFMAAKYLATGAAEVSFTFELYEVLFKGRVDWLITINGKCVLVGLKTARDCGPDEFSKQAYNLCYHLQWYLYRHGFGGNPDVVEIVVENTPPYDVAVYEIGKEWLDLGKEECERLLTRLVECRQSGNWPGKVTGVEELPLPRWLRTEGDISELGLEA